MHKHPSKPPVRTGHIRLAGWERVAYGVHVGKTPAPTPTDRLRAIQTILPESAAFTHLTAAAALGWWLPEPITQTPLFVQQLTGDNHPQRRGLLVTRHRGLAPPAIVDGCRIAPPSDILLAAARDLGILDLVIMGDSALRLGHCTRTELAEAVSERRRGAPRLRTVLSLLDARAESAWESVMRVLHWAADIPVVPQYEVYDDNGLFVARGDLRIVGLQRLHEYDGAVHRTAGQQVSDLARLRALTALDWQRLGFTRPVLLHRAGAVIRATDAALGRASDPRRIRAWNTLLRESTLTSAGKARIAARWEKAFH